MTGLFSKRISFYRATEVPDGQGGFISNGELLYTRWANVKEQKQIQKELASQVGNDKTYIFTVDARGLTLILTDIIMYGSSRCEILTISNHNEMGREYVITAVERKKI